MRFKTMAGLAIATAIVAVPLIGGSHAAEKVLGPHLDQWWSPVHPTHPDGSGGCGSPLVQVGDNSQCWEWCREVCDGYGVCWLNCFPRCAGNGGEGDPRR